MSYYGAMVLAVMLLVNGCQSKKPLMDLPILKYPPEAFFAGEALPLARVIRQNDTTALAQLLQQKRVDPNYVGKDGMTFLLWAYEHQLPDCMAVLVRQGADINRTMTLKSPKTGYNYTTHLVNITTVGPSETMLLTLLKLGANPDAKEETEPAVLNAVYAERYDRMRLLVEHGADVNLTGLDAGTLIVPVADLHYFDQAVWLVEHGAKVDEPNNDLALTLQETGATEPANMEWQSKLKKMLIERGVHFPVPRPWERNYIPIEAQWAKTPEGKQAQDNINRLGADPNVVGPQWVGARDAYMEALKRWMAANNITEPPNILEEDSERK